MGRVGRHFVMTAVFSLLMGAVIVSDALFSLRAKSGHAVVLESHAGRRSGAWIADVRYHDGDQPIAATLRTWFVRLPPGEEVPIIYSPDDPENVTLDRYFQRHAVLLLALAVLGIATITEVEAFKAWQRRQKSRLTCD